MWNSGGLALLATATGLLLLGLVGLHRDEGGDDPQDEMAITPRKRATSPAVMPRKPGPLRGRCGGLPPGGDPRLGWARQ
jgi:hypothetical protein